MSCLRQKKAVLKRIWIYLPLSVLAALVFAEAEYMLIGARPLIPDISQINLLELIVIMVFVVGLVEELIFRGILQTRLEEFLGPAGRNPSRKPPFWNNALRLRHSL